MLRLALRRSSTHLASKRALTALSSVLLHQAPAPPPGVVLGYRHVEAAQFHSKPDTLEFRSTLATCAGSAAEDTWFDDEKAADPGSNGADDESLEIAKLGISQEIVTALAGRGIHKLFPIQRAVLEPAMAGHDMYGRARTGTGKTLAFGIPILNKIIQYNQKHGRGKYPLALVLAPTRELARQVEKEFSESAKNLDIICVYGGTPIAKQMKELEYGVDVVVGTPGRVIDLMKRGTLNLNEVQFVIIDEADQMLAVGFVDDVETIFQRVPVKRQTMLFSATMPTWIQNLVRKYLKNPLTIDLVGDSDQKLADGISLYSIAADMYGKASILAPLVTEHAKGGKCIIFTQTKRDADRLAGALSRTLKCEALHGDITQPQRERTLLGFRSGHFNTLVATDVAARGLDVPNVDLVIHYEIPNSSETFVHRTGRTGRAGKKGSAILIYTQDQSRQVKIFEREVGCKFNELPRIAADSNMDLSNFMDSGSRYNSFGGGSRGGGGNRFGGSSRSSGYGGSGGGGFSSGYGGSGGGGFSSPRSSGGYNSNRSGDFGASRGSGNFGAPRGSGASERLSTFGDFVSGRSGRSGDNPRQNNFFGDFGKDRSRGFSTATSQNDGFSQ